METKKQKKANFFKRNVYFFILAFILIVAISLTVILFVTGNNAVINTVDSSLNDTVNLPDSQTSSTPSENKPIIKPDLDDKPEDTVPTEKPMTFIMPIDNATVICDYTATTVVYNKTLGIYTGHMAIDFSAPMGAEVKAVYEGTVESIETTYLTGTTVTIAHADGVKTVYNSIDAAEGLTVGQSVAQGFIIGFVSDNNKQEYKDGPHLHFEVYENQKKISPYKYLSVSDK